MSGDLFNPTVGFFAFIGCLVLSFCLSWLGLSRYSTGRNGGLLLMFCAAFFAGGAPLLFFVFAVAPHAHQ